MADLAEKVEEAKKVKADAAAFSKTLKNIQLNFKDLHMRVEDAVSFKAEPFDWHSIQAGFTDEVAHAVVQALYDHFPPFKHVVDGVAGNPEAIKKTKEHWEKDLPKVLDAQKAIADKPIEKVKQAWQSQLSKLVVEVMTVENEILDMLKEVAHAGACVVGAVGKLVDEFRKFLLGVLSRLIKFIVDKAVEKITSWWSKLMASVFGPEASAIAAAAVTIIETCEEIYHIWQDVEAAIDDVKKIIGDIKTAVGQGEAIGDDIKKLATV